VKQVAAEKRASKMDGEMRKKRWKKLSVINTCSGNLDVVFCPKKGHEKESKNLTCLLTHKKNENSPKKNR
jgi:hypothetical protein